MRTYDDWFAAASAACERLAGLGADDIDDWSWYDEFDGGATPAAAAKRALRNAGWRA